MVGYAGQAILPALDFAVYPGEQWVVVGRNGSGKSTLLKSLLGLLAPIGGRFERPEGSRLAYVPQRHLLDPHVPMRSRDVVAEGLEGEWSFLRPLAPRGSRARIARALERAGASHLAAQRYTELSEGQKQRVLLARALVAEPALMVLDEPTAAMDLLAEQQTLSILADLRREVGTAVLLVSHHLTAALAQADRALFLDAEHQAVLAGPIAQVLADPAFGRHFAGLVEHPEHEGPVHG